MIDIGDPLGVDITDKVILEYYKLEKTSDAEDLGLRYIELAETVINTCGGKVKETEEDYLR